MTRFNYAIIALPGFTFEGPIDSYDFSTDKTMITITIDGTAFKMALSTVVLMSQSSVSSKMRILRH